MNNFGKELSIRFHINLRIPLTKNEGRLRFYQYDGETSKISKERKENTKRVFPSVIVTVAIKKTKGKHEC